MDYWASSSSWSFDVILVLIGYLKCENYVDNGVADTVFSATCSKHLLCRQFCS